MPAVLGAREVLGNAYAAEVMSNDPASIRIMLVDDHALFRSGIAALVENVPDMRVVAEAANGREALTQFRAHRPDITLMDLEMPEMSGLDALIEIRREASEARIIVLTTYSGDVQALRALRAGACAYLLKDTMHKELRDAIRAVHAGRKALSPEVAFQLAEHAMDDALTAVEVRVLRLIAEGDANKEIGARLSVTKDTVKGHVRNIMSKLSAKDRTHAAMIGLKRGIIGP
jgi:DNA-binding NarL/FixJ family response regulator